MIEHVYRRAARARGVDAVLVATDDERVAAAVERFGGAVRMTKTTHRTGTDRIAEVARDLECDILVNVQGDLPFVEPAMIAQVVSALTQDPAVRMSTICRAIADDADYRNPHVVKVVVDRAGDALYFSRASIPYVVGPPEGGPHEDGSGPPEGGPHEGRGDSRTDVGAAFRRPETDVDVGAAFRRPTSAFKHIGMYGYRRDFLLELASLPQTPLEVAESLEQLRALEHGVRIRVATTQHESLEVDTAEDLARARRLAAVSAHAGNAVEALP